LSRRKRGVAIADGKIVAIGANDTLPDGKQIIDASGLTRV
jgi:imidazolonepropionase-like amidohydrolase